MPNFGQSAANPLLVTPLAQKLAEEITLSGPMGIDGFMARALFDAEFGYYKNAAPFGKDGDFITAPEISQIFGELIGLWCAQVFLDMGSPATFHLIETGPGRGTLMADILRATKNIAGFHGHMHIHLVETHPELKKVQQATINVVNISWHDDFATIPNGPSIIIGNEFLDCLPIRQFSQRHGQMVERLVGLNEDGQLCFGVGPISRPILAPKVPDMEDGAIWEVSEGLVHFAQKIGNRATPAPLMMLQIDYGSRTGQLGDSLQAIKNHQKCFPLDNVGAADLTAHVPFVQFADILAQAKLAVFGPVSQQLFLENMGIMARLERLSNANPGRADSLKSQVQRLIDKDKMGDLFSVIAAGTIGLSAPIGFDLKA